MVKLRRDSEKQDKRLANRALRRAVHCRLRALSIDADVDLPLLREVANVFTFAKDGKQFLDLKSNACLAKYMRK